LNKDHVIEYLGGPYKELYEGVLEAFKVNPPNRP
jgi:hypothetical protein